MSLLLLLLLFGFFALAIWLGYEGYKKWAGPGRDDSGPAPPRTP